MVQRTDSVWNSTNVHMSLGWCCGSVRCMWSRCSSCCYGPTGLLSWSDLCIYIGATLQVYVEYKVNFRQAATNHHNFVSHWGHHLPPHATYTHIVSCSVLLCVQELFPSLAHLCRELRWTKSQLYNCNFTCQGLLFHTPIVFDRCARRSSPWHSVMFVRNLSSKDLGELFKYTMCTCKLGQYTDCS